MNSDKSDQTSSSEETIHRAKALLQQGKLADAEKTIIQLLQTDRDNLEGHYILAVCQRYLKQPQKALETLARLTSLNPAYSRSYQELGHVHRQLTRNDTAAIEAYRQAVTLNPALIASWQALHDIFKSQGKSNPASIAAQQVKHLSDLPVELLSVTSMIHDGKLYDAEQLCRSFLKNNPRHVEAMRLLADLGSRSMVLDDAEYLLESCVEFEPDNMLARLDYVNVLYKRQKYRQSLEHAIILYESDPINPAFKTAYANALIGTGDFDRALTFYDEALQQEPDNHNVLLMQGHALKTMGRLEDAITTYRRAYTAKPYFGDAFWSLANLKTYRFTSDEILTMRTGEQAVGTELIDRIHLCFALGKAYEDRKDFASSMEYYQRGNALEKQQTRYDSTKMAARLELQSKICGEALFESKRGMGNPAADPIFIVGLPRAGSTLLEQILASHSQVDGTMELPNIMALAHQLNGRLNIGDEQRYPAVLHDLSADQLRQFGEEFIADTQVHRQGASFFIDKMPNNFRHIGLIHLILPNAKIIDARRHPMACCFSGFKQLFAEGQEFTYGLEEIGSYYRNYVELMAHWDEVLPGKVLRVQYEEVVADLESQVRRILDFCNLPFEQACLDFYNTERNIKTPSSEQVRQPIYQSGLEQWRNFEPHLNPLKEALGPALYHF